MVRQRQQLLPAMKADVGVQGIPGDIGTVSNPDLHLDDLDLMGCDWNRSVTPPIPRKTQEILYTVQIRFSAAR